MRIFIKFSSFLVTSFSNFHIKSDKLLSKKVFFRSFSTSSRRFSELDTHNTILFQLKVFGRKIKETTLVTNVFDTNKCELQFYANKQISPLNVKIGNTLQRLTILFSSDLNLLTQMSQSFCPFLHFDLVFVSSDDAKGSICRIKLTYDKILASTGKKCTLIFKRTNFT